VLNSGCILLVDDSPDDVLLICRSFKAAGVPNQVLSVNQGEEAIKYLRGAGQYADRQKFPVPSLMLLDLKMPGTDGFEVLTWVRKHLEWRCLPIIVLTSSYYPPDIQHAYDLGANSFLTKPTDLDQFMLKIREMTHFWLGQNILPEPGPFIPSPSETSPEISPAVLSGDLPAQSNPRPGKGPKPSTKAREQAGQSSPGSDN
jgi:CheY-like chemotaxis protein